MMSLKLIALLCCVGAVSANSNGPMNNCEEAPAYAGDKHVIFILADDLGYNDIGYNNPNVFTPRMDKLAREEGVILTSNYALPVCSPSRAALTTGMYPYKTMMGHDVLTPWQAHCVPTNLDMWSNYFQDNGYQTHVAGKWHMGYCKEECTPVQRGFDTFSGMYQGIGMYWNHDLLDVYDWWSGDSTGTVADRSVIGIYATDVIRDRGLDVINGFTPGDKPVFLYLPFNAPHTPLQAPQEYIDLYSGFTEEEMSSKRKTYLGMISSMDEAVGAITDALKAQCMWKNSIVVFVSDNGGEHGGQASNLPYRSGKATMYEGGARTVAFVTGGLVKKIGYSHDGLMHITDWLPTLASITGIVADTSNMDGMDQADMIIKGKSSVRNEMIYGLDMELTKTAGVNFFFGGNAGIRWGSMKMIWGYPGLIDGYGEILVPFYNDNQYLSLINKTDWVYTDIPAVRPHQYWKTPQEAENMYAIANLIGIYDVTRANMDTMGLVQLYDLDSDPQERNNLASDPDYAQLIWDMKSRVMDLIEQEYVVPQAASYAPHFISMFHPSGTWASGFCDGTTIEL